jgi:hypothetical protein
MIIFTAGLASVLVTRFGFKYILAFGMLLSTLGMALFTRLPLHGSYGADILPGMLLAAAGLGFVFVPLSIAAVAGVQPAEVGLASGLINASQQIGGALGLAILSTISTQRFNDLIKSARGPEAYFSSLVGGYHYAFAASTIVLAVGIILTLGLLPSDGQGAGRSIGVAAA